MDDVWMKIFVSEEAAVAFALAYCMATAVCVFVACIMNLIDLLFAKYKKKHDLM